jgi:hypothetical protein
MMLNNTRFDTVEIAIISGPTHRMGLAFDHPALCNTISPAPSITPEIRPHQVAATAKRENWSFRIIKRFPLLASTPTKTPRLPNRRIPKRPFHRDMGSFSLQYLQETELITGITINDDRSLQQAGEKLVRQFQCEWAVTW